MCVCVCVCGGGVMRVGGYEVGVYEGGGLNLQGIVRNTYYTVLHIRSTVPFYRRPL